MRKRKVKEQMISIIALLSVFIFFIYLKMNPEINMTPLSSEIINIEEQTVIEIENNTENFKDDNSTTDTEQSDISDPIIECL